MEEPAVQKLEIKTSRKQALTVHLSSPLWDFKRKFLLPESEEIISVRVTQVGLRTKFP